MLRVFFLGELEPEEVRAYLRGEAEAAARELAALRELRDSIPWGEHADHAFARYDGLVLEYGLRDAETRRQWAEWALEEAGKVAGTITGEQAEEGRT